MSCATAEGFRLGRFYPTLQVDVREYERWQARDVTRLAACRECELALLCGGGCARLVANRGGRLTEDIVCPPMVNRRDLQVFVDYYLSRRAHAAPDQAR
jgi:radical SAM protein with 4Fe4S-binding SPASM domain